MKKEWILVPLMGFSLMFCTLAEAQSSSRLRGPAKSPRIDIGKRVSASANLGRTSRMNATRRAPTTARRPSLPGSTGLNRARAPIGTRNPLSGGYGSGNALGDLLGQYLYNEYGHGRRYDPYGAEKAHAKAYRDAAIANAVVNVVGILATANQPQVQAVCPPQGVTVAPAGPRGRVERQRVLVQEARVEEYEVWIPEYRIPETGEIVKGHHETRRREVPAVYEEREVWVPVP